MSRLIVPVAQHRQKQSMNDTGRDSGAERYRDAMSDGLDPESQRRYYRAAGFTLVVLAALMAIATVIILSSLGMWDGNLWQAQGFALALTSFLAAWVGGYAIGRTRK